jgi:transglutaminase-like putative cysteine protease
MKWPARRPSGPPVDARSFDLLGLTIAMVLALHATHLPIWLVISLALLLGARWWQRRQRIGRVPGWLKLPLLAMLTLGVIVQFGNVFGREAGSALAVGLLVLKLLETESPRDVRVGIGFACFTLMAALLFDQGLVSTIVVMLGLLPALATLRALEPAHAKVAFKREFLPGLGLLGAALPLALLAFVLVPRLSAPLWGAPSRDEARIGLSDSMSPGGFTSLLIDDSPAMRVSFFGAPPAPDQRYFRAYVMSYYDGVSWKFRDTGLAAAAPLQATQSVSYLIDLEPTHQHVLPMLDVPMAAPAGARLTRDHLVMSGKPVNAPISYSASSATHYRLQPAPDPRPQRWLQLPNHFNPRTLGLGREWRIRYGSDDGAIVQAALKLFHDGGFSYTLAPAPLGRDAMDDFLFGTREGFCEHYSSAFTVLMRAAGIPARVVTGYQGGYWNDLGNYLLVRNSDAHAWSEVWLAGRGWLRVDPTAAINPKRISLGAAAAAGDQLAWYRNDWIQGLRNHWDIVNRWWAEGVTGFNALRQHNLLMPLGIDNADTRTLGILLALGGIAFILIGLAWALHRQKSGDPLLDAMRTLERKLAKSGVHRRPGEGPQHFLTRAARAMPDCRDRLVKLMEAYLELRYAHDEPPPESARQFRRAVRDFRAARVVK